MALWARTRLTRALRPHAPALQERLGKLCCGSIPTERQSMEYRCWARPQPCLAKAGLRQATWFRSREAVGLRGRTQPPRSTEKRQTTVQSFSYRHRLLENKETDKGVNGAETVVQGHFAG